MIDDAYIKGLRDSFAEWRTQAPAFTAEEASDLLCSVPTLLDEVERLREIELTAFPLACNSREFNRRKMLEYEHERDAYRAMLADLVAALGPGSASGPTPVRDRARKLLKDGPSPRENQRPPCSCGDPDATWHGRGMRVFCCDACWKKITTVFPE